MICEGTEKITLSKEIAEYSENIGGTSMAWTYKEYVVYYAKVTPRYLERAIQYLSEILFHSLLNEETIEKEKKIILEELHRREDNTEIIIWDYWFEWIWGKNQPLGQSIIGDDKSIKKITRDKLLTYLHTFYNPRNMVITIVGNFSEIEAIRYVNENFISTTTSIISPFFKKSRYTPKTQHIKLIQANTIQNQIIMGCITGVSYTHKDRFSLMVLANILGSGASSRIYHKLVYELGIAYTIGTYNWFITDTGFLYTYGGVAPENTEKAVEIILDEFQGLKQKKISETELSQVKEKSKSELYFSLETTDMIANFYAQQMVTEKRILTAEDIAQEIDKITSKDIQAVAQKYFTKSNLYLMVRGTSHLKKFSF